MSTRSSQVKNEEVFCRGCHCTGTLYVSNGQVNLVPFPSKPHFFTQKFGVIFHKHGGGTNRQWAAYMSLGTIFWLSVVLITNYIGLEKLTSHLTFLTTTCNREYKVCIQRGLFYDDCVDAFDDCRGTKVFIFPEYHHYLEAHIRRPIIQDMHNYTELEQSTNRKRCKSYEFYDLKICRSLCPIQGEGVLECNTICRQLLGSKTGLWGLICPGDELCPNGFPCPHYECEQISDNSMLQVGWYSGHLDDYFDPALIGPVVMNSWYELSELTIMRIDGSLLALYDYRTGNKTIYKNVHFGRPYGVNSGWNGHNFGGFERPDADYYDSYGNPVHWAPAEVDKNNVYVMQAEPATSVFYEGRIL